MTKFLDQTGLAYLWLKIKALIGNGAFSVGSGNSSVQVTTMNNSDPTSLTINGDGNWVSTAVSGNAGSPTITVSHIGPNVASINDRVTQQGTTGNYAFGTEYTVITGVAVDADDKGHVNSAKVTKQKIKDTARPIKVDGSEKLSATVNTAVDFVDGTGTDAVWTASGSKIQYNLKKATTSTLGGVIASNALSGSVTLTSGDGSTAGRYYGVQVDKDGKAFVNVPWTSAAGANVADLILKDSASDTGGAVFNSDASSNQDLIITGGTQIETARTTSTDTQIITINHQPAISAGATDKVGTKPTYVSTSELNALSETLMTSLSLTTDANGHVVSVTPAYRKIGYATDSTAGLMSAADKKALDNINTTIATALTSAITPSGSITEAQLVQLIQDNPSILSADGLGNLYTLTDTVTIGNVSGTHPYYNNFVEGTQLTNGGSDTYEIPAGSNLLVVNTGTAQNPNYQIDVISSFYDMSKYWAKEELVAMSTTDIDNACV